jgi:hypothetical protein
MQIKDAEESDEDEEELDNDVVTPDEVSLSWFLWYFVFYFVN